MDRFYVISNSMKDPEGKIAKEIKAYLNFRGKQCIIQERQGKESLRSYKYTNANLIPDDTECILVVGGVRHAFTGGQRHDRAEYPASRSQ